MKQNLIVLFILHCMTVCNAYYASPLIRNNEKSLDKSASIKEAAEILNVPLPNNWSSYMGPTTTTGSFGQAQVGSSTITKLLTTWSIPAESHDQVLGSIKLLIDAASEGRFLAQTFIFNIQGGSLLSSLLVIARKIDSPSDPNIPIELVYVTITSKAEIKKLYNLIYEEECRRCMHCFLIWKCCCERVPRSQERGNTQEELIVIKQKLTADQFIWFNQQNFHTLVKRTISTNNIIDLNEILGKYLSNNIVKIEIFKSYNDSILTELQSNITSLKLSSQILKLTKIQRENLPKLFISLSNDYGFDNIYLKYPEQLSLNRFSYENLFTYKQNKILKYIWILGENIDTNMYTISLLHMNITSKTLINNKDINIVRTSILNDHGEFISERLLSLMTPWKLNITNILLNILRFSSATKFSSQKISIISNLNFRKNRREIKDNQTKILDGKTGFLTKSISSVVNTWKDIVTTFQTSSSTTITKITRLGFTYFHQRSVIFKTIDIPANKANDFLDKLIIDYNLPLQGSTTMGITLSEDIIWECNEYFYSPKNNSIYHSFTLFKNGGLFQSTHESIQEIPKTMSIDEAIKIQQFFMIIATANMAANLGISATYPSLV